MIQTRRSGANVGVDMKTIWSIAVQVMFAIGLLVPSAARAQSASGTVRQIVVQSGGVVFVRLSSSGTERASCAADGRWAFSVNTPDGQAMLATLLTLQASQKPTIVVGKGSCSVWGDSEDVGYIVVQ